MIVVESGFALAVVLIIAAFAVRLAWAYFKRFDRAMKKVEEA